ADFSRQSQLEMGHVDSFFSMYVNNLAEKAAFFARTQALTELPPGSIASYYDKESQQMTPDQNSETEQAAFALMDAFGQTHPEFKFIWLGSNDKG
ncbi:methyl-accepting chemotaxis protein, partial [Marinomonas arenicola]